MDQNNIDCPSIEIMECYFSNELDEEKRREIEEHFFDCSYCIPKAREISLVHSRQRIAKANPYVGLAWEKYGDSVEVKAAGENHISSIREFTTKNGKFKVTLRPLEKKPELSLLEIEVRDNSIIGQLKVSSTSNFDAIVDIDENNMACSIVSSSIDLERIIIRKHC